MIRIQLLGNLQFLLGQGIKALPLAPLRQPGMVLRLALADPGSS
jgi:hypothetical protein